MAFTKKGSFFRVTGLPASERDDELNTALKTTIEDNLSEEEKSSLNFRTAIVPSYCDTKHERVTLVDFHSRIPLFLSELVRNL
jgi:hypothetical protein